MSLKTRVRTLSESSEDEAELPRKQARSMISFGSTDRSSTEDHSPPDDDLQLSDEDCNLMDSMVKYTEQNNYVDNKAQKMMERMGYKVGHGLGKHDQGRVNPVEMSLQRGRRGLGLHLKGLEAATLEWDSSLEVISVEETVSWLEELEHEKLTQDILTEWLKEGPRKITIDDETNFCDPNLLKNVLSSKSVFDQLEPEEKRRSRTRSNPFETIRGGLFLNRAAMKMANMDKVFDFMFTKPKDEHDEELVGPDDLLYFADVCAGPGGFSEYVLWRRQWKAKGFGFTLKGDHDFQLGDFYAGPCETFEPHYGVNGADGDGDIFSPDNIMEFIEHVLEQAHRLGVHFMMADGGFSVDGQENIQEILSKQLYLCQFLVSLFIVRVGGNFVCKVFDLFTPFSVGLVYLLYKSYKKISIHKPNTSRPANSERNSPYLPLAKIELPPSFREYFPFNENMYIICKWKREDADVIAQYLYHINERLWKFGTTSQTDIVQVVPLSILTSDSNFFDYIVSSNNSLGERQIINLVKIAAFCRDINLVETQQAEIKRKCLSYWEVPDRVRTAPPRMAAEAKCAEILKKTRAGSPGFFTSKENDLRPEILDGIFKSIYDWHCMVIGSSRDRKNCAFYLGLGRKNVYKFTGTRWQKIEERLDLSPDTLLYGEMVLELSGEGKSQRKITTLHIMDAICLGGMDVTTEHLTVRHKLCSRFAEALTKKTCKDLTPIRVKKLHDMEVVDEVFYRLDQRMIKGSGGQHRLVCNLEDNSKFFIPGGLMFFKATQEPWMRHESKTTQFKYYYHATVKESKYDKDRPKEACRNFMNTFKNRQVWWWEEGVKIHDVHVSEDGKLQRDQLLSFVNRKR